MFGKLEFLQCLEPVSYNGSTIDRPARTVLRPGDEVFVCSSRRTVACEKSFIIFGFFPWDRKNPDRGSVLVVDPGVVPRDASNLRTIFRVCPIKFVGLVPGGKHINEAGGLLHEVEPLCRQLFNEFATSDQINPLSPLDLTTKPKSLFLPKTSTSNERPKRKQVPKGGAKPAPLKILPAKLKRISPTSSPVASTKSKVQKVEPIKTPPYAKRIENMLGKLVSTDKGGDNRKLNSSQLTKLQTQLHKVTTQKNDLATENRRLTSQLHNLSMTKAENDTLCAENTTLRAKIEEMKAKNTAQAEEINQMSMQINFFKETIGGAFQLKKDKGKKSRKPRKFEKERKLSKKQLKKLGKQSSKSDSGSESRSESSSSS